MAAPVQVADALMLFEVAGKIEEAGGAEEKAAVDPRQPRQAQSLGQGVPCIRASCPVVLAAALRRKTRRLGNCLDQGRFAGAILANQYGDGSIEAQFEICGAIRHRVERKRLDVDLLRTSDEHTSDL